MSIREEKVKVVEELKTKFNDSSSVVLVDYKGLNVQEATELRETFREAGVDYKVYKNTLAEIAVKELGYDDLIEYLVGPTAIAFSEDDPVAPAKILTEAIRKYRKMALKGGIVDGKIIDIEGVRELAELPSREELIAKMLGSMNAPISNFVGVLNGTMRALVYALNGIKEQKEA